MTSFTAPDGTELAYRTLGEDPRPPVVCLPGGPMQSSAYLGDLGGLAAHRRLLLLDPRGTGGSALPENPGSYRADRQAADVEALRAHLGLERLDLLAHSAGGDLAVHYAARHPERVRSLVLLCTSLRGTGVRISDAVRREAALRRSAEPWFAEAFRSFENIWAGKATSADWSAITPFSYGRLDAAARESMAASEAGRNKEAAAHYYGSPSFDWSAVAALTAPVLVLAGELDVNPPASLAPSIAARFPHGESAVVPGAAHYPWLDAPEALVRAVTGFLPN